MASTKYQHTLNHQRFYKEGYLHLCGSLEMLFGMISPDILMIPYISRVRLQCTQERKMLSHQPCTHYFVAIDKESNGMIEPVLLLEVSRKELTVLAVSRHHRKRIVSRQPDFLTHACECLDLLGISTLF